MGRRLDPAGHQLAVLDMRGHIAAVGIVAAQEGLAQGHDDHQEDTDAGQRDPGQGPLFRRQLRPPPLPPQPEQIGDERQGEGDEIEQDDARHVSPAPSLR
ncbi:hypothetical protein D3874_13305 [Oleomonas cavernae]|uniref:Uncharacterized protein n=1 Tax=Oleomonas cavernae TaxID=2320859 RepID=A0A418WCW2_9PROT|nr:hypothetical protein D3874_13305 [Oleomonas cavernae]